MERGTERSQVTRLVSGCLVLLFASLTWTIGRAQEGSGQRVYQGKCSQCHGSEGRGGNAPRLVPFEWSDEQARELVREPVCDMPPIPESELSDDDLAQIVTYLRALK
jgi:mono/diheme cytochrome c family protein